MIDTKIPTNYKNSQEKEKKESLSLCILLACLMIDTKNPEKCRNSQKRKKETILSLCTLLAEEGHYRLSFCHHQHIQ